MKMRPTSNPKRSAFRAIAQTPEAGLLTVAELARRVGADRRAVRYWLDTDLPELARERWPSRAMVEAQIAEALGVHRPDAAGCSLIDTLPSPDEVLREYADRCLE